MTLTLKPIGAACNMKCSYCYYREKANIHRVAARMGLEVLRQAISQYADAMPPDAPLQFLWHGGEPTLMPLDFYSQALDFQRQYARGRQVFNSLQTNGLLLSDDWCRFLADNHWLVGISIDGPAAVNDAYRLALDGSPTHSRVIAATNRLNSHGVEWNVMATVNSANVRDPQGFYDFFLSIGARYIQFSPIVERLTPDGSLASVDDFGSITPESVTPDLWGDFLCGVFDRWVCHDVGRVFVQIFDATLACHLGATPGVCIFAPRCPISPVIEADGSVYACDHMVFPGRCLGNIMDSPLKTILKKAEVKKCEKPLPDDCRRCRFLSLCHGECPRNRFLDGRNYLCRGYLKYFEHTAAFMSHAAHIISTQNR